jgi:hypothetical protein
VSFKQQDTAWLAVFDRTAGTSEHRRLEPRDRAAAQRRRPLRPSPAPNRPARPPTGQRPPAPGACRHRRHDPLPLDPRPGPLLRQDPAMATSWPWSPPTLPPPRPRSSNATPTAGSSKSRSLTPATWPQWVRPAPAPSTPSRSPTCSPRSGVPCWPPNIRKVTSTGTPSTYSQTPCSASSTLPHNPETRACKSQRVAQRSAWTRACLRWWAGDEAALARSCPARVAGGVLSCARPCREDGHAHRAGPGSRGGMRR